MLGPSLRTGIAGARTSSQENPGSPGGGGIQTATGVDGVFVDATDPENIIIGLDDFPLVTGYLGELYTQGLPDPTVRNALVGSYFTTFFDNDGHIRIVANAYDDGSGGLVHPALETVRRASNAASFPLHTNQISQYDPGGTTGGMHDDFRLRTLVDVDTIIARDTKAFSYNPVPEGYFPVYGPLDNATQWTMTMLRRAALGGAFDDIFGVSSDGTIHINQRLPNVITPQTLAAVFVQSNRVGGGMFAGQGGGWWQRGVDGSGFGQDQGRWNFTWNDPTTFAPIGQFEIDLMSPSGNMLRAMTLTPSQVDFNGSLSVVGLLEGASLLVDDLDVINDVQIDGDMIVNGTITADDFISTSPASFSQGFDSGADSTVTGDLAVTGNVTAANITGGGIRADYYGTVGSSTWNKPTGARFHEVFIIGNGGPGGSGRRGAAGVARGGGGGGGSTAALWVPFLSAQLPASLTVTIGAQGIGGAAVAVDATNGNPGVAGGDNVFGTGTGIEIGVHAGGGGAGGTAAGGAGGLAGSEFGAATARLTSANLASGSNGANGGAGGAPGGGSGASVSPDGLASTGGSGGGGAGISAGNAGTSGGNGGAGGDNRSTTPAAGTGGSGATAGGAGGAVSGTDDVGGGGGGGGGASDGTGRTGGAGGARGGAGGGGGASLNGTASGAGGNGALGAILVISYST